MGRNPTDDIFMSSSNLIIGWFTFNSVFHFDDLKQICGCECIHSQSKQLNGRYMSQKETMESFRLVVCSLIGLLCRVCTCCVYSVRRVRFLLASENVNPSRTPSKKTNKQRDRRKSHTTSSKPRQQPHKITVSKHKFTKQK